MSKELNCEVCGAQMKNTLEITYWCGKCGTFAERIGWTVTHYRPEWMESLTDGEAISKIITSNEVPT